MNVLYDSVSLSLSLSVAIPKVQLESADQGKGRAAYDNVVPQSRSHQLGAWLTIKEHQSASEVVHRPTPVKPDGVQMNINWIQVASLKAS